MDFLKRYRLGFFIFAFLLLVGAYILVLAPPRDFPAHETVAIKSGASVSGIASELFEAHIIRHPSVLWFILRASGASARVQAGTYLFDRKENVLTVAYRLAIGAYNL